MYIDMDERIAGEQDRQSVVVVVVYFESKSTFTNIHITYYYI